jgi:hypothetical protein
VENVIKNTEFQFRERDARQQVVAGGSMATFMNNKLKYAAIDFNRWGQRKRGGEPGSRL